MRTGIELLRERRFDSYFVDFILADVPISHMVDGGMAKRLGRWLVRYLIEDRRSRGSFGETTECFEERAGETRLLG